MKYRAAEVFSLCLLIALTLYILLGFTGVSLLILRLGIAIGIGAALIATRVVESLLYGVKANDSMSFVASAAMVLAIAVLAVAVPARRAMAIDPVRALRYE